MGWLKKTNNKIDWDNLPLFDKMYHSTVKTKNTEHQRDGLKIADSKLFHDNVKKEVKIVYSLFSIMLIMFILIVLKNIIMFFVR